jgi:hypothetical protein
MLYRVSEPRFTFTEFNGHKQVTQPILPGSHQSNQPNEISAKVISTNPRIGLKQKPMEREH